MGGLKEGGGGRGFLLGPPSSLGPPWSPPKAGQKFFSLNPLDTEGAEAKFWLSALNIGSGGGGLGGGTPSSSYGLRPF